VRVVQRNRACRDIILVKAICLGEWPDRKVRVQIGDHDDFVGVFLVAVRMQRFELLRNRAKQSETTPCEVIRTYRFYSNDFDIADLQVLLDMVVWSVMAESKNGSLY